MDPRLETATALGRAIRNGRLAAGACSLAGAAQLQGLKTYSIFTPAFSMIGVHFATSAF